MDAASHPSSLPSDGGHDAEHRIEESVDHFLARVRRIVRDSFELVRFLVFVVYMLGAILAFWLWAVSEVMLLIRTVIYGIVQVILWVSGGIPRVPGETMTEALRRDLNTRWSQRTRTYATLARPLAARYAYSRRAAVTFWFWSVPRKAMAVLLVMAFVVVPALYIVPRPHYVQVVDDNSLQYDTEGKTMYLINAVDLFEIGKTREYVNETAWWLGKVNPQGLKNRLHPGRFYKLWVIGIRWYWMPRLFPNIVWALETDSQGNLLENPSHFIPPTTTGS